MRVGLLSLFFLTILSTQLEGIFLLFFKKSSSVTYSTQYFLFGIESSGRFFRCLFAFVFCNILCDITFSSICVFDPHISAVISSKNHFSSMSGIHSAPGK